METISALFAALLLFPLVLILAGMFVALIQEVPSSSAIQVVRMTALFIFSLLLGFAVWLAVDFLLTSPSLWVSLICCVGGIAAFKMYGRQLNVLAGSAGTPPTLDTTVLVASSLIVSYMLFVHCLRIGMLHRDERVALSRTHRSGSFWQCFLDPLPIRYGHRIRTAKRAMAAALLILSKIPQGVALLGLLFALGSLMFTLAVLSADLFRVVFGMNGGREFRSLNLKVVRDFTFLYMGIGILTLVLTQVSISVRCLAQWLLRASFDHLMAWDDRNPILFLRHFKDDQVTLPQSPVFYRCWLAQSKSRRLDHELVERFSRFGPVVAIGRRGEKNLPFGAARVYVSDEDWQQRILELASKASSIVVVVDESEGINWEIGKMLCNHFVEKTLFLASPQLNGSDLRRHSILGTELKEDRGEFKNSRIFGAYRLKTEWKLFASRTVLGDDYVVCCSAFFHREVRVCEDGTPNKGKEQLLAGD